MNDSRVYQVVDDLHLDLSAPAVAAILQRTTQTRMGAGHPITTAAVKALHTLRGQTMLLKDITPDVGEAIARTPEQPPHAPHDISLARDSSLRSRSKPRKELRVSPRTGRGVPSLRFDDTDHSGRGPPRRP